MTAPATARDLLGCALRPHRVTPGVCDGCGRPLTGRQTAWCSPACRAAWEQQHDWPLARAAAVARDGGACVRCGAVGHWRDQPLEVNHITPRAGRGYNRSCAHHLDGLETLCVPCHRATTREQAEQRALSA